MPWAQRIGGKGIVTTAVKMVIPIVFKEFQMLREWEVLLMWINYSIEYTLRRDDFLKWASDDKVTRYLGWNTITSREEALSYLDKVAIPQP
ncbi:hypothetical protein REPUB_Repub20aG0084700 [Reevesia pubescens]